jgi:hypothetical protein
VSPPTVDFTLISTSEPLHSSNHPAFTVYLVERLPFSPPRYIDVLIFSSAPMVLWWLFWYLQPPANQRPPPVSAHALHESAPTHSQPSKRPSSLLDHKLSLIQFIIRQPSRAARATGGAMGKPHAPCERRRAPTSVSFHSFNVPKCTLPVSSWADMQVKSLFRDMHASYAPCLPDLDSKKHGARNTLHCSGNANYRS